MQFAIWCVPRKVISGSAGAAIWSGTRDTRLQTTGGPHSEHNTNILNYEFLKLSNNNAACLW